MKNAKISLVLSATASLLLAQGQLVAAANFTVQMTSGDRFSPTNLSIAVGDTVTWTNLFAFAHTSTSGTAPAPNGLWSSGDVPFQGVFTFTFANFAANTYPYFCVHHYLSGMTGSLTITNATIAPPSVSITNPATGTKFLAPANITLMADAVQAGGTVTNVQFFSGASSLGNVLSAPYNFTANNTAAGNYSFQAVAKNNQGGATTSAVVNVFVLTNAILSNPLFSNGQFQVTILGIAGQTYAIEASTTLTNWSAISTNLAPANNFNVTDPSANNIPIRFYRARQDF